MSSQAQPAGADSTGAHGSVRDRAPEGEAA